MKPVGGLYDWHPPADAQDGFLAAVRANPKREGEGTIDYLERLTAWMRSRQQQQQDREPGAEG